MKSTEMLSLEGWRHPTAAELRRNRKAIEEKLGIKLPPRGRPMKRPEEKYLPVSLRLHPLVLKWAKKEAKRRGTGYQTVINQTLLKHAA